MTQLVQLQGTVGAAGRAGTAAGQSHAVRMNRDAAYFNAPVCARFQEAVLQGNCFGAANQTGVTTQAGLSATEPVLTLFNPAGSGKYGVLWYAGATFEVAFAAGAAVFLAVNTNVVAAAVTGTALAQARNLLLGSSRTPTLQALTAATLPAAPVAIAQLGVGLTGEITTVPTGQMLDQWFDGSVILLPGTAISIQTRTASGASGTFCTYKWQEIDV